MEETLQTIREHIASRIGGFAQGPSVYTYGVVQSCADGIVQIDGLYGIQYGELLSFEGGAFGMALELSSARVGAVLLSEDDAITAGCIVRGTGHIADVAVGSSLLGRVVDPIGRPIDGKPLTPMAFRPIECPAPAIMDRAGVNEPLQTGILSIDSMIPIGKGQRELIIGDRQTGKTTIALSAMRNQSRQGVICIYCAIGQKASTVARLVHTLTEDGAMPNCIVVSATASTGSSMQYIAPYAACSIGESFMLQGKDVLVIYDDLSKHAASYRAMSLLLHRPPGREAYPGDVFYLHSRLLERAAKLSPEKGGGSMTALPIVETMAGDISAYIPTNVISITDGQIYLESEYFNAGVRPAVNVGLSVSRVGRSAQPAAIRKVSGNLRLELAQYREMAVFSQFGSDIDAATKAQLARGELLTELLKQDQNTIFSLGEQTALLLAFNKGAFAGIAPKNVGAARADFLGLMHERYSHILAGIDTSGDLSSADEAALTQALGVFAEGRKQA